MILVHPHAQERCIGKMWIPKSLLCTLYTNKSTAWSYPMFFVICWKYVTAHSMNFPILKNQNIRWYKTKLKVHLSLEAFNVAPPSHQNRFLKWADQNISQRGDYLTTWRLSNLYSSQSFTMVIKPRTMMTHATGMQQIKKIQIKYLGWNIRKKATTKIHKS